MYWEKLIERVKHTYYAEFLMYFVCILIIIFYFSKRSKSSTSTFSVILATGSLLQGLFAEYLTIAYPIFNRSVNSYAIFFYTIIEVTCCLLFIRASIKSPMTKKLIFVGNTLFVFCSVIYWVFSHTSWRALQLIHIVEGFLIMAACLYYFYEWLIWEPEKKLLIDSIFLTISSMLLLFGIISPLFLFRYFFNQPNKALFDSLFLINYWAYILLFTSFAVAFFLDKKTQLHSGKIS